MGLFNKAATAVAPEKSSNSVKLNRKPATGQILNCQIIAILDKGVVETDFNGVKAYKRQFAFDYAVEGGARVLGTKEVFVNDDGSVEPVDYVEKFDNLSTHDMSGFYKNFLKPLGQTFKGSDDYFTKFLGLNFRALFKKALDSNGDEILDKKKVGCVNIGDKTLEDAESFDVSGRYVPKWWITSAVDTLDMKEDPKRSTPENPVEYQPWAILGKYKDATEYAVRPDVTNIAERLEIFTLPAKWGYVVDEANGVKRGLNPLYQKRDDKAPAETAPVADAHAESAPVVENATTSAWD